MDDKYIMLTSEDDSLVLKELNYGYSGSLMYTQDAVRVIEAMNARVLIHKNGMKDCIESDIRDLQIAVNAKSILRNLFISETLDERDDAQGSFIDTFEE